MDQVRDARTDARSTAVVRLRGVRKHYRDVDALAGVDVDFTENRIHGLLGRNGAGKTTLMSIVTGQAFATSGEVSVFGENPVENARVLRRVCFIREAQRYPEYFRPRDAFAAAALAFPDWDAELATELVEEFRLPLRRPIKKLSRGQLSAVGVIIGLASRAPLTFFDEPYLGLDAVARQLFYDRLLADYAAHPRTIVLSTHLIDEVADLLEHVVVIDEGRVLLDAEAEDLRGRAVCVSGPVGVVDAFAADHELLHRETLGAYARVTVAGDPQQLLRDAERDGLTPEPVSLQALVVRTILNTRPTTADQGELI